MRSVTPTATIVVAVLAAVALVGCDSDGGPGPSGSPSASTQTDAPAEPAEADDLDELIVVCDTDITPVAERAAGAARRSMGSADPHGEDDEEPSPRSTTEAARQEARAAARSAADVVSACLERTTELAADSGASPDRRLGLVQNRLRDLSRALGVLEQALQQGEAVNEPAQLLTRSLEEWRRLAAPLRSEPSPAVPSPSPTATSG